MNNQKETALDVPHARQLAGSFPEFRGFGNPKEPTGWPSVVRAQKSRQDLPRRL